MNMKPHDIIVIGGGVGGYTAALRAAHSGASVVLVEHGHIGGTCLNIGCIPTKALLESCRLASRSRNGEEFGVITGDVRLVPAKMVERSRSVVSVLTKGVADSLARMGVEVVRGKGSLVSPSEVAVTGEEGTLTLRAGAVIVATGSNWVSLPGVEIDGEQIITSDHALNLDRVPDELVIVGGGAIGCEFAEIYTALGVKVTIIEMMDHLLPTEDAELAKRLQAALARKRIRVMTGSKVSTIEKHGGGVRVEVDRGDTIEAGQVLMSIGRAPNTEGLGLEEAGIEVSAGAVQTDESMRSSVPGVYAVGDVTGKWLLAHVALMQGVVAGTNASGGTAVMDYTAVPRCVYTDPELAAVGLTEAEARAGGKQVGIHRERLGRVGRALTLGETFGMAKAVYDKDTGAILGFQVLGPHASELLSEISVAIRGGMGIDDIARVIHPHPTLSELVWEVFYGAANETPKSR